MHCLNFLCQRLLEITSTLFSRAWKNRREIAAIKEQTPCNDIQPGPPPETIKTSQVLILISLRVLCFSYTTLNMQSHGNLGLPDLKETLARVQD